MRAASQRDYGSRRASSSTWRRLLFQYAALASVVFSFGCPQQPNGGIRPGPPPPPRTLGEIVGTIEANARRMNQALWSNSVGVSARFTDRDGRSHLYNLDGSILFQPPRSLRMDLRPAVGDQVMQIGSNQDEYWIWIEPELHAMWWGRYEYVGLPCTHAVAVQPDQLAAALGLGGLPRPDDDLIGPARKYGEAYDILYYMRSMPEEETLDPSTQSAPDESSADDGAHTGYWLEREYWIDRSPPYLIRGVQFRDELGRVETSAILDDYAAAWENGPWVPQKIRIEWPLKEGRFTMSVGSYKAQPRDKVSPRAFDRPMADKLPRGVTEVTQVDADCEPVFQRFSPEEDAGNGASSPGGTPSTNRPTDAGQ